MSDPDSQETERERSSAPRRESNRALKGGSAIGRFVVLAPIGAGGMGEVFSAYDPELDRKVAIKMVAYAHGNSRDANVRLLREAQAMARLSHANVVPIFDVGEVGDRGVFIAMEYVEGQTLGEWLKSERRDWRTIRDVIVQAGRGLHAAHQAGLVHRDFKPANVLIDVQGRARVTDFGIARLGVEEDVLTPIPSSKLASGITPLGMDLTKTGAAVGTPAYMAPEQHRGRSMIDGRADQFAFCVTAWEAFYGQRPYEGDTNEERVTAIERATPRGPLEGRDAPSWIAPLLRRGLAARAEDRWPSLAALLDRLADDPEARRTRRLVIAGVVLAGAALAGGVTWLVARRGDPLAICSAGDDDVWKPATKTAVRAAFEATHSPLVGDSWPTVEHGLDRWAASWSIAHRAACEAHVRHEQSDELHDRRMTCLDRQHNRLRALVELLGKPDAALVRESPMAVAALPPTADCADADALLAAVPPPTDKAVRDQVKAVNAEIDRANTLITTGRFPEAKTTLEAAIEHAKKIAFPDLQAALQFGMANALDKVNDPKGAEQWLHRAVETSALAHDTKLYTRSWISLLWEVGAAQARFDDAKPIRDTATQMVHLHGDSPDLAAQLEFHGAAIDYMRGDIPAAVQGSKRAIAYYQMRSGPNSLDLVAPLNLLGAASTNAEESDGALHRALAILEEHVGSKHPRLATMLSTLGNAEFNRGHFDLSIDYHRRALKIVEEALGKDSAELAAPLNNLAQPLWAVHKYDEAFAMIDRARVLWEGSLGPEHPYVGVALTNLGGLRNEQKRCAEAYPYLERALAILAKGVEPENPRQAMTLMFKATCLNDDNKPADALPIAERAIKMYDARGDKVSAAGARFELARALWSANRDRKRAVALAEDAYKVVLADPADQAIRAARLEAGSDKIATWLADKR